MKTKTLCAVACTLIVLATTSHAAEDSAFDAEQAYQATCFACHGTGAAHSPEVGDHGHARAEHH